MKVFVTTKALLFHPEIFLDVHAKKKDAEKSLRKLFPHMRKSEENAEMWLSDADASKAWMLFIHEVEVK